MTIYEIVDSTSDEQYLTLAIFDSFEKAKEALDLCDEPPSECYDDYAIIEIRERPINKWDASTGKVLLKRIWERNFDDSIDEKWVCQSSETKKQ